MKKVYLIRGNDGKYKIGTSKNPEKRIKPVQTGNPDQLKIIETYTSINATKIEVALHNKYSYARNVGEWFDLSISEELDFLENCRTIDNAINILKKMGNIFI